MSSLTMSFDTLKYAKKLITAGVSREQAEAQAEAFKGAIEDGLETSLATKPELQEIKQDIHEIRQEDAARQSARCLGARRA